MGIVRRRLEGPCELTRVRIERDDAAGVQVVAGAHLSVEHRCRITRAPEHQVQVRVVGAGHPYIAAGRLALGTHGVGCDPVPLRRARVGIQRADETLQVIEVARSTHDDMVADDQGRHGGPLALGRVGDHNIPQNLAGFRIQRKRVGVRRHVVDPVFQDGHAALPDVKCAVRRSGVPPQLVAGTRVDGPDVIGHREVQNAIHQIGVALMPDIC